MFFRAVVFFLIFLGPVCLNLEAEGNILEYPVTGDRYAIVVVQEGRQSRATAKKIALERAASITKEKGYRSFSIVSEKDVQVARSDPNDNTHQFYGNMYQELIIEGDFNRDRLANQDMPKQTISPAYRLVIQFNN